MIMLLFVLVINVRGATLTLKPNLAQLDDTNLCICMTEPQDLLVMKMHNIFEG